MTDTSPLHLATTRSPVGFLRIIVSDVGLRAVLWERDTDRVKQTLSLEPPQDGHPLALVAVHQIQRYFDGDLQQFDLPLDLVGTEFQVAAWLALATIPYGETVSYTQQATRIGRPTAVRAIGAANGRNPASIVLPCHRVIGAGGSLTGFAGGLDAKRWLLDHERAHAGLTLFADTSPLPSRAVGTSVAAGTGGIDR